MEHMYIHNVDPNKEDHDDSLHVNEDTDSVPDESSNGICMEAFKAQTNSCPSSCKKKHEFDFDKVKKGICFFEFSEKGFCRRGDDCWFTHQIPDELREDRTLKHQIQAAVEKIQEFRKNKNQSKLPIKIQIDADEVLLSHRHGGHCLRQQQQQNFLEERRRISYGNRGGGERRSLAGRDH